MTDKAFEYWWRLLKPAECDEVEEHFRECWQAATATERERCAKACEAVAAQQVIYRAAHAAGQCAAAIRALPEDTK